MHASIRVALSGAVLLLAGLAAAANDALPQALPPEQEAIALASAERTGREIYEHDRAAALATDALMAQRKSRRDRRVRGWVTEARADGIAVTFVDATPAALYRVLVPTSGEPGPIATLDAPEPLSPFEASAVVARNAAMAAPFELCSKDYNTVVLPSGSDTTDRWRVYLLPGTKRNDAVPLGGTHRMDVEGGAVTAQRAFTKSCISLGKGRGTAAMMITHLLDPVPTEAHVHWSLWANTPMFVMTPPDRTIWSIEHGAISKLDPNAED
ncbi:MULTISPECIES: hypothetical protein [unclassified Luteimonas]|uniref:hypothetical protein n=1 Tax=unclassified Luteimonas TaxID=2629088 RepID=UPI00160471AE|nr:MULTISPECIES: hypothetical protein [unclassified Luteimonas]MBB1471663.1 hypothetical protein [Luteimonas sp. MC1782]MBB6599596.1 hypothetical protein [Luteimonas sp. MC1825]QOC87289.1 hypothetical protein IDM46_08335 [Luteimonas sp. MC1825]